MRVKPAATTPEGALPLSLARQLVDAVHLTSVDISDLCLEDAIARMQEFWSRPSE